MKIMRLQSRFGWLLAAVLLAGPRVRADLRVGLRLEHQDVLQYERVVGFLTVYNESSSTLVIDRDLGIEDASARFVVTDTDGDAVKPLRGGSVLPDMRLPPGGHERLMVDTTQWVDFSETGRYIIRCDIKRGGRIYESNRVLVEVLSGIELVTRTRTLPGYENLSRRYSLRYWRRDGKEYLFLRVEHVDDGSVFETINLGRLLRFTPPRLEVGLDGRVVIVHQSGGDRFTRTVFQSERDGMTFVDRVYLAGDGRPHGAPPVLPDKPEAASEARSKDRGGFWRRLFGK